MCYTCCHWGYYDPDQQEKETKRMYQLTKIGVEGVGQGLLMNNPAGMAAASARGTAPKRSGKNIPEPMVEATGKLYILPDSKDEQLYAANDWFREAAIIASKEFKDETRRGNATMMQRFGASVFLSEQYSGLVDLKGNPITADPDDWELYLKRVVVQQQGVVRARPWIQQWATTVEFEYDDETIRPELIATIMHRAGKFPGVGDYRPGKKGPFGRFRVTSVDGKKWVPEGEEES